MCKKIHRGGNAEQYNADKKYKEAVAVAVEACADDTKGQKCYICLEAVHSHTGEGLVRGCACGDRDGVSSPELGVAHVSCLARQAKILVEEAVENKSRERIPDGWQRWHTCSLCEQRYHGVVMCALGWACWKTYVGRPETDGVRNVAMYRLGCHLFESRSGRTEEALTVFNAHLDLCQRVFPYDVSSIMCTQMCLGNCYSVLGRSEDAFELHRAYYEAACAHWGIEHEDTVIGACAMANSLQDLGLYGEVKSFLPQNISAARRTLGPEHHLTLSLINLHAHALMEDGTSSEHDLRKAVTTFEDTNKIARRVFGRDHPMSCRIQANLELAREKLTAWRKFAARAEEASRGSSL